MGKCTPFLSSSFLSFILSSLFNLLFINQNRIDIDLENSWGGTGDQVVCGLRAFFKLMHNNGYFVSMAPQTTALTPEVTKRRRKEQPRSKKKKKKITKKERKKQKEKRMILNNINRLYRTLPARGTRMPLSRTLASSTMWTSSPSSCTTTPFHTTTPLSTLML